MKALTASLALACVMVTGEARADPSARPPSSFAVVFENCTEFAGLGKIASARIEGRLPAGYVAATFGPGISGIVARAARCERVSVDGKPAERATVSHIGINLAPDGSADISNYTLLYVTDSHRLAQQLRQFGLPAVEDAGMVYEVNPAVAALEFFAQVQAEPGSAYFLAGTVSDPPPAAFPFLANWWFSGSKGRVKMATAISSFSAGGADVALYTSRESWLGRLLGANRTTFPVLSVRGVFAHAVMTVTLER